MTSSNDKFKGVADFRLMEGGWGDFRRMKRGGVLLD